jgi:hypothetical protein
MASRSCCFSLKRLAITCNGVFGMAGVTLKLLSVPVEDFTFIFSACVKVWAMCLTSSHVEQIHIYVTAFKLLAVLGFTFCCVHCPLSRGVIVRDFLRSLSLLTPYC